MLVESGVEKLTYQQMRGMTRILVTKKVTCRRRYKNFSFVPIHSQKEPLEPSLKICRKGNSHTKDSGTRVEAHAMNGAVRFQPIQRVSHKIRSLQKIRALSLSYEWGTEVGA